MRDDGDASPGSYRSKAAARRVICGIPGLALLVSGALLPWGCSTKVNDFTEPVSLYAPVACGNAAGARATYIGLGDFQPSLTQATGESVSLSSTGFVLAALPTDTRDVILLPDGDGGWSGAALVPDAGPVNLLTSPFNHACTLSESLSSAEGVAMGPIDATHMLVVGGVLAGSQQAPSFVVDLGTGSVTATAKTQNFRLNPTVTPFGSGVLVAGGNDPSGNVRSDTEVFTPTSTREGGTFSQSISLRDPRTQGSAVTLSSGETLLVGGTSHPGDLTARLSTFEILDPVKLTSPPVQGLLTPLRLSPTVLALPNGQVFIGGGTDGTGHGLGTVAFATIRESLGTYSVVTTPLPSNCFMSPQTAFTPTEGGAVLAVIGGSMMAGCSNVMLLRPPPNITSAPILEPLPPLTPAPSLVWLFPGPQASPLLFTGATGTPTGTGILRWNPWSTTFTALPTNTFTIPAVLTTVSNGLGLWVGEDQDVWLLRFDTRGAYATDVLNGGAYFTTSSQFTAPDRLPGTDVSFTPGKGLTLGNGASVFVTDATFADVTVQVTVGAGGPVDVVLRQPSGVSLSCSVPAGTTGTVTRAGSTLTGCGATTLDPGVRVSVGLVGPSTGMASVTRLTVTR